MDISFESDSELTNEQQSTDIVNTSDMLDVTNESDIEKLSIEELIYDDILDIEKNKNIHLPFTEILNKQKINICRKEYILWLNENYEMLESAFYIICNKYLDDNVKINFNNFTEFCFLYN